VVRLEVLTATSTKIIFFWDAAQYSLVDTDISEELITLMMESVSSSETSVNIYQTTRLNIPEDSHAHTQ
jgi:hypothetical protein